jgi:thioredoxin
MTENPMARTPALDSDTLPATILGPIPVLVDFWAPWCAPCRVVGPVIEQLAGDLAGTVRFAKVNVDEEPGLADRLAVRGIPTLVLFADGREVGRHVGALPRTELREWLLERVPRPQEAGYLS